ncbi:MAG: glutamate-1-semialdehyde 2,1-aminomutase [Rhodobacterales bacterium]|nr:glutamate-1-semialdehyde 2,1-aminomutase [Rhodobacterales bacterium]
MSRSSRLMDRALAVIPGGVNSPVRAFAAVGGEPPFIDFGEGAEIVDVDGHRYIDLVCSWGALMLGHAEPSVLGAAMGAASRGSSFGAPTEAEIELAELLIERVPCFEQVRLCSSGTLATMHAIRLARGATGRDKVLKFSGCYHGAHDSMLVSAGSGVATFATPGSPGIPASVAEHTLVAPFNDLETVAEIVRQHGDQLACIIVEPVAGNMGAIGPVPGFLEGLRALCDSSGALLIFDEVMSGFRVGPQSAQGLYGVMPDLSTFGKIVGGGYPLAAFGGRADIMQNLAPVGAVYQAGTLSGNPVAVAAGIATLKKLDDALYERLEALGKQLDEGLSTAVQYHGISYSRIGGMFTLFFRDELPHRFDEVQECDLDAFGRYFGAALAGGVYLPPSQFEAVFLSAAMTDKQMLEVISGLNAALVSAHAN